MPSATILDPIVNFGHFDMHEKFEKILCLKFDAYQNVQTLASTPCVKAVRGSKKVYKKI